MTGAPAISGGPVVPCSSGKRRYATRRAARTALIQVRARRRAAVRRAPRRASRRPMERTLYACPACCGWHLTTFRP